MTTDWRALCADLVAWADYTSAHYYAPPEVLVRARAALAQPEPEGPTLDDIWELCEEHGFVLGIDGANEEESANSLCAIACAALARWGTPNLTETRSSLKDAWAAHQPAIEAAAKAGMDACRVDGPAVSDGREPASVIEDPSDEELLEDWDLVPGARAYEEDVVDFARAVLARWGRPTTET